MAQMYTVAVVRAQIEKYVLGEIDRVQLDEWLFPLLWPDEGPADALDLGWSAELSLMETSRGHLSEEELRASLRALVDESVPA